MNWITKLIVNALSVFAAAYLLPGVDLASFVTAIIVAIVMSILNLFLRPVLILLTIPITLFTFGLFLLVINAIIVMVCSNLVNGFKVDGIVTALLFSIVVSVIGSLMNGAAKEEKK